MLNKLCSQFLNRTFLRFLIVGGINTLVGTGVMFFLYNVAGCGYWFSSVMNYVVGSVVSFFLNKYFTFQTAKRSGTELLRFILNITVCYAVAYGAARPLAKFLLSGAGEKVRDNVGMLFGMGLFVILNYLGQRLFVFRPDGAEEEGPARSGK